MNNPEIKENTIKEPQVLPDLKVEPQAKEVGINLIPTMTREEVVVEEKKKKVNVGAVASLLALVLITIGIVGFNIFSKMQLNAENEKLYAAEDELEAISEKIIGNDEIVSRVALYKQIQEVTYSPKKVVDYLSSIAKKSGNASITSYTIGNELSIVFEGYAEDLENVSKFWYLLSNEDKVENIDLKSVGKSSSGVRFTFEGNLVFDQFITSSSQSSNG